jgi:O-antigen/teichoic acid export membrane protein
MGTQAIRFGTNLVLTRLLAPDLFGLMVLLTSIRLGLELFTDVGITQNVIANPKAREPDFYNTAWTLQILRAVLLGLVPFALMPFADSLYPNISLEDALPYLSAMIIVMGLHSVGLPLAIRDLETFRTAVYELASSAVGSVLLIVCVLLQRDIYGLLYGSILSIGTATIFTYGLTPGLRLGLKLDRTHLRDIIGLGKWVFISSVAFFLATNFDRLILAKYVTLAGLGIYGLARSLADIFGQFGSKIGSAIIFPSVASMQLERDALRKKLAGHRRLFLGLACCAIALLIAAPELLIGLLYDHRYQAAASVLPIAAAAVWIGILNALNENVLLGVGQARYLAGGNVAKFVALLIALPYGVSAYGIVGAAWATVAAEVCRYAVLSIGEWRTGLAFKKQDLLLTIGLLFAALTVGFVMSRLGIVESWPGEHLASQWLDLAP